MGVAMVLSKKVIVFSGDADGGQSQAPVLPERFRKLALQVKASTVLSHGGFGCDSPAWIDCVRCPADDRSRHTSLRSKAKSFSRFRDDFSGVPSVEEPLAHLPLGLDDIQDVFLVR